MFLGDKVLIVDDQEGIRRLLVEICSMLGCKAAAAASGMESLKLIKENKFEIAFIDLKMPGLNGLETLELLQAQNPRLKGVLMTGYDETHLLEEALKKGAHSVILKPFELEEIKGLLENLMVKE